ncbi:hypothetical protein LINPERHAP1_LOCUS9734 [Linum perenne]
MLLQSNQTMNSADTELVRRLAVALLLMLLATNGVVQSAGSCRSRNIIKSPPRNGKPHLATTNNIGSSSGRYQALPPLPKAWTRACSSFSSPGGHG